MSITELTPLESAAKAMNGVETSRRVGWAKAFDNAAKLDEALQDVNLFRGDRDAYRKGLSFMFGLFMEWTRNERSALFKQVIAEVAGYDAVLDSKLVQAGRRRAIKIREADVVWQEEQELAKAAEATAKNTRVRSAKREWTEAKLRAVESLGARYGFQSVPELHDVLARWQEAAGREPADPRALRSQRSKRRGHVTHPPGG